MRIAFSSVAQLCPTLCNPMDCSMLGLPVHHQLPEFTQTYVHQWCHPIISSSAVPFSSLLRSFPASGSFQMSQFFISGGQNIGVLASASVLPMNIQDWFPLGWTGWISQSKGLKEYSPTPQFKSINSSVLSFLYCLALTSIHDYSLELIPCQLIGKTIALTRWNFVGKVMSLLFNKLSRLVIAILPRNKRLLISWIALSTHFFNLWSDICRSQPYCSG